MLLDIREKSELLLLLTVTFFRHSSQLLFVYC